MVAFWLWYVTNMCVYRGADALPSAVHCVARLNALVSPLRCGPRLQQHPLSYPAHFLSIADHSFDQAPDVQAQDSAILPQLTFTILGLIVFAGRLVIAKAFPSVGVNHGRSAASRKAIEAVVFFCKSVRHEWRREPSMANFEPNLL